MPSNRIFPTPAEAQAFVEGIEYANDRALSATAEGCVVTIDDEDDTSGLSIQDARAQAQAIADAEGISMVVGYQHDDFTNNGRAYGYCPKAAIGPAFVYEVLETIEPRSEAAKQVQP